MTIFLLQIISSVGLVFSPFWIGLLLEDQLPTAIAVKSAIAIAALRMLGWMAPKLRAMGSAHATDRRHLDELATRQFNIVKELFAALPEDCLPQDDQWRLRLSDRITSCILHISQSRISGGAAAGLQCTFIGFEGDAAERLRVFSRAKDTRPIAIDVPTDQTIAFYVAMSGRYFVVNDLKSQKIFPQRGLSHPKANYRSIMLIPVIVGPQSRKRCVGVVTLDSPRPCEFWGDIGDSLATQLIPFVHILTFVMRNGYPAVPVKDA